MLTSLSVENAKARSKPYKLPDEKGLHLFVQTNGNKLWRFRYRFAGKENTLGFGSFPEVSLASARSKRDDARKLIADGKDPSQQKKLDKIVAATAANNTFGAIAEEHLAALKENGAAEATLLCEAGRASSFNSIGVSCVFHATLVCLRRGRWVSFQSYCLEN